ncbi:MAG: chitinase, partial [Clostridia bacterium]|nr:chitinase [Clostridia bacterium]
MKMLKKTLALALCVLMLAGCMTWSVSMSSSAAVSGLPTTLIVGYWHNFNNGSTTTKLANVHNDWDVINVSFMETEGDRCTAKFAPDTDVYPSNGVAQMKADIQTLQSKGKKVVISLGGQNGSIGLGSTAARDTFLSTSMAIIDQYGFDGFDVDLEGSSITISGSDSLTNLSSPIQVNLNYILHYYVAHYGSDFLITMAPEHPYVQGGSLG